ncbi:MAG: hypothetical protein CMK59_11435 [Proteobacteria bacterium]|nr:hypothetical protein [Pseudomonadota bacterium]
MSINWGIWSYSLPLLRPLAVQEEKKPFRKGFLIGNKRNNIWFFGEAAPLSGIHNIDHKDVFKELHSWIKDPDRDRLKDLHSITQFAIESSMYDYFQAPAVPINGLCTNADTLKDQYRSLKIKVGRSSIEKDLELISQLALQNPQSTFRLDPNGLWSLNQTCQFWSSLQKINLEHRIEYIEDPVNTPKDLHKITEIPIALDQQIDTKWLDLPSLKAIIIKPSVQGGVSGVKRWQEQGRNKNIKVILSSTFETSIGIGRILQLATPQFFHGLGTLSWFAQDICTPIVQENDLLFPPHTPPQPIHFVQREA